MVTLIRQLLGTTSFRSLGSGFRRVPALRTLENSDVGISSNVRSTERIFLDLSGKNCSPKSSLMYLSMSSVFIRVSTRRRLVARSRTIFLSGLATSSAGSLVASFPSLTSNPNSCRTARFSRNRSSVEVGNFSVIEASSDDVSPARSVTNSSACTAGGLPSNRRFASDFQASTPAPSCPILCLRLSQYLPSSRDDGSKQGRGST